MNKQLGTAAYGNSEENNADLLQNLEGCTVHRFSPGTEEHLGTALMVTELPTEEGLGVPVIMNEDRRHIPTYPATEDDGWSIDETPTVKTLTDLETDCPALTIQEIVHKDLMNPENARIVAILETDADYYALDIHINENGNTEFFEVPL